MIHLENNIVVLQQLDFIEKIAREAGDAIMRVYKNAIQVQYKLDHSPLTEADLIANKIIIDALKKKYPEIPTLSEESVIDFKGPNTERCYWLVDPLDGTKEFIKGNGEFTVNIALIHKGEPVLGVVYAPAKELIYRAVKGYGAFKREGAGLIKAISTTKHISGLIWKVVGSRSHLDDATSEWLDALGPYTFIPMGSSLKMCLIAEGEAHIYPRIGPTSLWDTAAAHAILKEAGGEIRDLSGYILNYDNPKHVLNPSFIASSDEDFVKH